MSDSLQLHGLQHTRILCPSPFFRVCLNSCPLSRWCHPTISSSVVPFSCLQSFPASGSFLMSWFFTSGGQSTGASASTMNSQGWFPLGLTGWISLQSKDSEVNSPASQFKSINSLVLSSLWSNSHPYMTTGKTTALTKWTFVGKVMSLFFNMLLEALHGGSAPKQRCC